MPDANQQAAPSEDGDASSALSNTSNTQQIPAAIDFLSDLLRVQQQTMTTSQGSTLSRSDKPYSKMLAPLDPGGPQKPDEQQKNPSSGPIAEQRKDGTDTPAMLSQKGPVPSGHGTGANARPVTDPAGKMVDTLGPVQAGAAKNSPPVTVAKLRQTFSISNAAAMSPADQQQGTSLKSAESNSNSDKDGRTANPQDQATQPQSFGAPTKADPNSVSQSDLAVGSLASSVQGNDAVSTIPVMPGTTGSWNEGASQSVHNPSSPSPGVTDNPGRQAGEAVAPGSINVAKLIHRVNETEMQVGMHSAEFGNIAIRTSVANERLTAEISLDHNEMGKALANQLPGLQSKLGGEYGINARIEIHENSAGFSGGLNQGSSQQSQQQWRPPSQSLPQFQAAREAEQITAPRVSRSVAGNDDRLDVRA